MRVVEATRSYLDRWHRKSRCRKCAACSNQIKPGQYAVHHRLAAKGFADTDLHIHVACLRRLLDGVPEDAVEPTDPKTAVAKIRREAKAAALQQAA